MTLTNQSKNTLARTRGRRHQSKFHTETGIPSICGIRPRGYPPPDALMETRDSSQVVQPLAEKGGLFVIPWRGRVRFHETIDDPPVPQAWFPLVIDEVAYRQHGNCLSAPPVGSLFFGLPNDFFHSSLYGLMTHTTLDAPLFSFCYLCFFLFIKTFLLCCADCAMIPLSLSWTFPPHDDAFVLSSVVLTLPSF